MVLVEFHAEHRVSAPWEDATKRVVEFLPVIPRGEGTAPLVAVEDDAPNRRAAGLRSLPNVSSVDLVSERDARSVFRVTWADDPIGGFAFDDVDGHLLRAVGRVDGWHVTMLFDGQGSLTSFWEMVREGDVCVTVETVKTSPTYPESVSESLSSQQRETLCRAVERGYFGIPRGCTAAELGEEFDISDQAVSERLRRGTKLLVERSLSAGSK